MTMQQLLFSPIPLDSLKSSISEIIRTELQAVAKQQMEERMLSPAETCAIFKPKISKTTLAKWTKEGHLKEKRIGGRVYYKMSDVIAAVNTIKRYSRN